MKIYGYYHNNLIAEMEMRAADDVRKELKSVSDPDKAAILGSIIS
jgi:hypothetical protein